MCLNQHTNYHITASKSRAKADRAYGEISLLEHIIYFAIYTNPLVRIVPCIGVYQGEGGELALN